MTEIIRWLRCHVLRKHRPNSEDFYEACLDCGWWESGYLKWCKEFEWWKRDD